VNTREVSLLWGSQISTLTHEFDIEIPCMNDKLLDKDLRLDICFHSEFLSEVKRIDEFYDPLLRNVQLQRLAQGVTHFFRQCQYLDESREWTQLYLWLYPWLENPLITGIPVPLYSETRAGDLFFGKSLFETDLMSFLGDVERNCP
jgi:hypothetical protein